MSESCECTASISELVSENQFSHASSDSQEEYFSFNNWDSTDPELPPLQFQLFTFLRALCMIGCDFSSRTLSGWQGGATSLKMSRQVNQRAVTMKATNYLTTNQGACRFACRLVRIYIFLCYIFIVIIEGILVLVTTILLSSERPKGSLLSLPYLSTTVWLLIQKERKTFGCVTLFLRMKEKKHDWVPYSSHRSTNKCSVFVLAKGAWSWKEGWMGKRGNVDVQCTRRQICHAVVKLYHKAYPIFLHI